VKEPLFEPIPRELIKQTLDDFISERGFTVKTDTPYEFPMYIEHKGRLLRHLANGDYERLGVIEGWLLKRKLRG
jgi:hypothetical protein